MTSRRRPVARLLGMARLKPRPTTEAIVGPGFSRAVTVVVILIFAAGCRQDMHNGPRYEAFEANDQFADGRAARVPPAGTVARGLLRDDEVVYTGKSNGQNVDAIPFALSHDDVRRGRERFSIYCTPCHGQLGDGNGMVVQRGLRQAANFHQDRLRQEPIGYFFDVITNGFGAMQGYAEQVPVRDRWLIAAYVRALQYSQNAALTDVPQDRRGQLDGGAGQPVTPAGTPPPASGTGQPPQRPEGTKQ
jgi:mono/diheme cytochrome c family protein